VLNVILVSFLLSFTVSSYGEDDWCFSGFASLGVGRIYEDNQRALDYENKWSFNSDSVLGLQLDKELSEQWGFTGQLVANGFNYTGDDIYTPELEWLLLRFEPTGNMQFRFGRIRNPLYYYSATLEVGYTYPWVRPSANTYPSFADPFKHLDGIDFVYSTQYGDADVEYQLVGGRSEADFRELDITNHSVFGANVTVRWWDFMWRINAERINVSILAPATDPLKKGFQDAAASVSGLNAQAAEEFLYISNNLDSKNKNVDYLSASFMWEPGLWVLMTEGMVFNNEDNNFSNDATGFYISLAYQWGNYTPYISYGEYHNDFADGIPTKIKETEALISPGTIGLSQLDALRTTTVALIDNFDTEQESILFGIRYDFHDQANIKIEIEYFNFLKNTSGSFTVDNNIAENPEDGLMTSLVIDVVF
jgi:hypothetical protein